MVCTKVNSNITKYILSRRTRVTGSVWLSTSWETNPTDNSNNRVAYGNGIFVSVSWSGGDIKISRDEGKTWVVEANIGRLSYASICFDGTGFLIASRYKSLYSVDGIIWDVLSTQYPNHNVYGLTYGSGVYVAIADSGTIGISTDGIAWTQYTPSNLGGRKSWVDVCFTGSKFVALNSAGYIMTTNSDRISSRFSWTTPTQCSTYGGWVGIIYYPKQSICVAITSEGRLGYTVDDTYTSWNTTSNFSPIYQNNWTWSGICCSDQYCLLIGDSHMGRNLIITDTKYKINKLVPTDNLLCWRNPKQDDNLVNHNWYKTVFDGTKFVSIGSTGNGLYPRLTYSYDGNVWCVPYTHTNLSNFNWFSLCWDGTQFIVMSTNGYISKSPDAMEWTEPELKGVSSGYTNRCLCYCQGLYYFTLQYNTTGSTGYAYLRRSPDLSTWNQTILTWKYANGWTSVIYCQGIYLLMRHDGLVNISTNGTTWGSDEQITIDGYSPTVSGYTSFGQPFTDGIIFYVFSSNTLLCSSDGLSWSVVGTVDVLSDILYKNNPPCYGIEKYIVTSQYNGYKTQTMKAKRYI